MKFEIGEKKLKREIFLIAGLIILSVFTVWSVFPQVFTNHSVKYSYDPWLKPSIEHILGTNDMGYDIFTELVYSASTTIFVGLTASFFTVIIGTLLGTLAGFSRKLIGEGINGIIEVFLLIPMLPLVIVLSAYMGPGVKNVIIAISILGWCSTAKAVRAKVMQLKESPFMESLNIIGIKKHNIIIKHIIPNISDVVSAKYILSVSSCMIMEASLSFMGLGDPTQVTWGGMINYAFKRGGFVKGVVNWYLPPGICISLCVIGFFFISIYIEQRSQEVTTFEES